MRRRAVLTTGPEARTRTGSTTRWRVLLAASVTVLPLLMARPSPAPAQIVPGTTTTVKPPVTTVPAPPPAATTVPPSTAPTPTTPRTTTPVTRRSGTTTSSTAPTTTTTVVIRPSSTIPPPPPTTPSGSGPSGRISAVYPALSIGGLAAMLLIFAVQAWLTRPRRRGRWTL